MRLGLSQANSCTSPSLVLYVVDSNGNLYDPFSIEFLILGPDGVEVVSRVALDLDPCPGGSRLGKGRFVPPWTVPVDAETGIYQLQAFVVAEENDPETEVLQPFEVTTEPAMAIEPYASIDEFREEGVSLVLYPDDTRLRKALLIASRRVEMYTQRFFGARYMSVVVDGAGVPQLKIGIPIIALDGLSILYPTPTAFLSDVAYRVYNRHLTGYIDEDDRSYPRIEVVPLPFPGILPEAEEEGWVFAPRDYDRQLRFPAGSQNIRLTGLFGYTDPDGSPIGSVPEEIKLVTMRMALMHLPGVANQALIQVMERRGRMISESTRDQSYTLGDQFASPGLLKGQSYPFTGIGAIDEVLLRYRRKGGSMVG